METDKQQLSPGAAVITTNALSERAVFAGLLLLVALLVAVRVACEFSMMSAHGPDAQMEIWVASMAFRIVAWALAGLLLAGIVSRVWSSRSARVFPLVLLGVWAVWTGYASAQYYAGGRALAQASASGTSPKRLEELIDFAGIQAGYELDNRIAANPRTTAESLRRLYERNNLGTNMVLARNPSTPNEILEELAKLDDKWINESLKRNPSITNTVRRVGRDPP